MFVMVYLNNFPLFKNYVVPIIKLRKQTKIGHVSRNSIASEIAATGEKISSIKVKRNWNHQTKSIFKKKYLTTLVIGNNFILVLERHKNNNSNYLVLWLGITSFCCLKDIKI